MHDWFGTWLLFFPYTQLMSIFFRGVGLKPPTSSVHIKPIQIPAKCPANKIYGSPFTTRYRTKKNAATWLVAAPIPKSCRRRFRRWRVQRSFWAAMVQWATTTRGNIQRCGTPMVFPGKSTDGWCSTSVLVWSKLGYYLNGVAMHLYLLESSG